MTTKTATAPPADDLRTPPPKTYGQPPSTDPATAAPQVEEGTSLPTVAGSGGRNQFGDIANEEYRHKPLLLDFLDFVRVNRAEDTALCYQSRLRPLLRAWEDLDPEEWTSTRFFEYVVASKNGVAPGQRAKAGVRAIQLLLISAKLFGEWLLEQGIPLPWVPDPKDPTKRRYFFHAVKKPRNVRKEVKCPTLAEAQRMMEVSRGQKLELALGLAVGCGLRKSEVARVAWSDWDETGGTLLVRREKTGLHHKVPVPAFLVEVLKRHQGYIDDPDFRYREKDGLMLGKLFNVPRNMAVAAKAAGVERPRFHDLRHCWASELTRRGAPPAIIMRMGGWSSMAMLARYSHALGDSMKDAAKLLG